MVGVADEAEGQAKAGTMILSGFIAPWGSDLGRAGDSGTILGKRRCRRGKEDPATASANGSAQARACRAAGGAAGLGARGQRRRGDVGAAA